jgi:hypothetical protein
MGGGTVKAASRFSCISPIYDHTKLDLFRAGDGLEGSDKGLFTDCFFFPFLCVCRIVPPGVLFQLDWLVSWFASLVFRSLSSAFITYLSEA